jgi:hypothetical protein
MIRKAARPVTVHCAAVAVSEQVAYEARVRPRWALVAGGGGLALFAAAVMQASGPQPKVSELTVELITFSRRAGLTVGGAVVNALGLLLLAATLVFLLSATRARRPATSRGTQITAVVGGVLAAAGGIAYGIEITAKARQFVSHGAQTYVQANSLISGSALPALQYVGLVGALLMAIAFVLVSLAAMRVGLLTRFLGYLGIVAAAASILLIQSLPAAIIEIFWLLAVAYLLAGRWPGGDPPSWRTGQAEPWPSATELREQRERARRQPAERAKPAAKRSAAEPEAVAAAPGSARASAVKRKRKRRK